MLSLLVGVTLLAAGTAGWIFCHLRHFGLTMLVLLAPLPGVALVLPFMPLRALSGIWLALLATVMSLGVGLVLAGEFTLLVCEGAERKAAVRAAYRRHGAALGAVSLAVTVALAVDGLADQAWSLSLHAAVLVAAANSSVLCFFALARFLPCREDFVASHNRAEERWRRLCGWLIAVAAPRWGFTVVGIALVFAALGYFGAQPLRPAWQAGNGIWIAIFLMAVLAFAALAVVVRDWRNIMAAALALPVPFLLGLWGLTRAGPALDSESLLLLLMAIAAGAVSLFAAGTEAARRSRAGDNTDFTARGILLRDGRNLFFAGATPALALLLSAPATGATGIALAVAAGSAGAGALLFRPAFAAVIENWLPRATTLASHYRLP